jgi:hypothetical protein
MQKGILILYDAGQRVLSQTMIFLDDSPQTMVGIEKTPDSLGNLVFDLMFSVPTPISARGYADFALEQTAKISGIGKSYGERNFGHVQLARFQQRARLLDTIAIEVHHRTDA